MLCLTALHFLLSLVWSDNSILGVEMKSPLSEMVAEAGLVQKSKKGEFWEEDVDIGEEIPLGNFPPVVIDKDATACAGSGSSGSSCSTSSSDSSSSSGN